MTYDWSCVFALSDINVSLVVESLSNQCIAFSQPQTVQQAQLPLCLHTKALAISCYSLC